MATTDEVKTAVVAPHTKLISLEQAKFGIRLSAIAELNLKPVSLHDAKLGIKAAPVMAMVFTVPRLLSMLPYSLILY